MNTIESLEAYLAYKEYMAAYQATQATGQRGALGSQDDLGPDTSQSDQWVPGQGSTRTPLYTSHERFRVAPDGVVVDERASGRLLMFSTAADGTIRCYDPDASTTTVFSETSGHVTVQVGTTSTLFDTPGNGTIVEHNADSTTTTFTLNADDSLSTSTQRWYDDGQAYTQVGGVTQYTDTYGNLVHQVDASGVDQYYRNGSLALKTYNDANGHLVREYTHPSGSRTRLDWTSTVTAVFLPDGTSATKQADNTWRGTDGTGAVYSYGTDGWPTTKTASGTTTTWSHNATTRTNFSNGNITWTGIDGITVTKAANGTVTGKDAQGNTVSVTTTTLSGGGTRYQINLNGGNIKRRLYTDLRDETVTNSGITDTRFADGSRTVAFGDGTTVSCTASGACSATSSTSQSLRVAIEYGGRIVVYRADGSIGALETDYSVNVTSANGVTQKTGTGGGLTIKTESGLKVTVPSGSGAITAVDANNNSLAVVKNADNTLDVTLTDGSTMHFAAGAWDVTQVFADHHSVESAPDGTVTWRDTQNRVTMERATDGFLTQYAYAGDGTSTVTTSDGNVRARRADGTTSSLQKRDGTTTYYAADGTTVTSVHTVSGITVTYNADGSRSYALPNGWTTTLSASNQATTVDTSSNPVSTTYSNGVFTYPNNRLNADLSWDTLTNNVLTQHLAATNALTLVDFDGAQVSFDPTGVLTGIALPYAGGTAQATHQQDGTWQATIPGGASHGYRATGTVSFIEQPDTSRDDYDPQGRVAQHRDAAGTVTSYSYGQDGTRTEYDADGRIVIWRPDGTRSQEILNSITTSYDASGNTVTSLATASGITKTFNADGSVSYALPGGLTAQIADGVATAADAQNSPLSATLDGGGSLVIRNAANTYSQYLLDPGLIWHGYNATGSQVYLLTTDGASQATNPDASVVFKNAGGAVTQIQMPTQGSPINATHDLDGTWSLAVSGDTHTYRADGSELAIDYASGAHDEFDTQSRLTLHRDASAQVTTYTYAVDGTKTETDPDGTVITWRPDGTRQSVAGTNGITTTYRPDGAAIASQATLSGVSKTNNTDGSTDYVLPNGYNATTTAGGDVTAVDTRNDDRSIHAELDVQTNLLFYSLDDSWIEFKLDPGLDWHSYSAQAFQIRVMHPDASSESWLADGTDIARDAAGIATSIIIPGSSGGVSATHNQDGTWSATFVNGDLHTWRADGSLQTIDYASGARNEYDAEGHLTLARTAAGVVTTYAYADGALLTTTTTALDGSRTIAYADGHTDWQRADGTLSRRDLADGEMQMFDASGTHLTLDVRPDGTSDACTWAQDGSHVISHRDAQGAETTREGHDPAGFLTWTRVNAADGTSTTTYASGITEHRRADDTLAERDLAAGAVEMYDAQGTLIYTRVTAQDGSSTFTYADGVVEVHRADGTLAQRTLVSGTVNAYRTDETLERITLPNGTVETYDAAGLHRTTVTRPNGTHDAYTYAADDTYVVATFDATDVLVERRAYSASDALLWTRVDAEDGTYTVTYPSTVVEHYRADDTLAQRDLADYTVQTFDAQGRMIGVSSPDGATETITYAADGSKTAVYRDAAQAWVKTAFYRADATLDRIEHADGATEYFDLDGDLMTSRVLGDGTVEYVDDEGRVERRELPDGSVTRITWQENGRTEDTDDAQGAHVRHATYDAQGALVLATYLAANGSSHLTYGSGLEEWLRPDATLERRLRLDGAVEGYDAAGTSLLTVTWPDQRIDHVDPQGRLVEVEYPNGSVAIITYNANATWRLHLVDAQQAFVRDEDHRADGSIERITFADGHVDLYDATGSRVVEREYLGGTIDQLDVEGRVVREDRGDGTSSLWSFAPDGANTRRDYDDSGLETERRAFDGAGTLLWSRVFAADRTSTTTYASGRVEHLGSDDRIQTAEEANGTHETWTWAVDGTRTVRTSDGSGFFVRQVSFTADGVQESLEHPDGQTDWFDETGTAVVETDFPGGRMEFYDAQGRIVQLVLPDGESELIAWAPDGGRTVTSYDADGWEVEVRAYDAASTLLWTKEEAEDGTAEVVYPGGQLDILRADQTLVTRFLVSGDIEHYLADGLRVDHVDRADGSSSVYAWTGTGHSVSDRDAQGVETRLRAFDADGALLSTRVVHADGTAVITYPAGQEDGLRADGTLQRRVMPNLDVITFEADGVHRVQLLRADASHIDYAYDTAGCTATDRSAEGAVTAVSRYDLQGAWLETRTDAADGTHELLSADGSHAWYRADDTLSRRTAADGSDTRYADDGVHVLRTDYADGASVAFSYDEAGEVQTTTHIDTTGGRVEDYADGRQERYSSDGTLLYARAADGTAIRHDWAGDGSHADVELDAAGLAQRVLGYDAENALVSTRTYAPDRTSTLTYESGVVEEYRADGTLASRSIPENDVTQYENDGVHVTRITHPDASAEVYTWSTGGAVTVSHLDADGVEQQRVTTLTDGVTITRAWATDRSSTASTRDADGILQRVASYDAADAWLQTVIHRPDGTVRTEFADGHAEVRSSQDLLLSTEAGGVTTSYDAAGTVTSRATISGVTWTAGTDGAFTVALPQGLTVTVAADGTATTAGRLAFYSTSTGDLRVDDASSSFVQYLLAADLSTLTVYASATSLEKVLHADGGRTEYHATGDVTFRPDGTVSGIALAGESASPQPDGTFRLGALDATTTTWDAQGVRTEHVFADGVVERYDAQGRVTYRHAGPDEMVFSYSASGAFTVTHSGGNQDVYDAQGQQVAQVFANGVTRHFDAAFVTTYEETGSGVVRTPHADGSVTIVIPGLYTVEIAVDGSAVATDGDGVEHVAQYAADTHELHVGPLQMNGDLSSYSISNEAGQVTVRVWASGDRTTYDLLGEVTTDLTGTVKQIWGAGVAAVQQADGTWRLSPPYGGLCVWDAQGHLLRSQRPDGRVAIFDAQRRPTSLMAADGTGIALAYDGDTVTVTPTSGGVYVRTLAAGATVQPGYGLAGWYDAQDRPLATATSSGLYTYAYDDVGTEDELAPDGQHTLRYADGVVERTDAHGRLSLRVLSDQTSVSFTYLGNDVQREWTTGLLELCSSSGTVIRRSESGTTTWFDAQGRTTVTRTDALTTVTTYATDGTPSTREGTAVDSLGGLLTVSFPEGDAWTYDDHGVATRHAQADGSVEMLDPAGAVWATVTAAGTTTIGGHAGTVVLSSVLTFNRTDGVIETYRPDGTLSQRDLIDGTRQTYAADGATLLTETTYLQGHLATLRRPNGDLETYRSDGSMSRVDHADGAWEAMTPDGLVVRHAADGAVTGIALGGASAVQRITGGWFLAAADGTDHTFTASGSRSQDFPVDGSIITWYGDGTRAVRDAEGALTRVLDAIGHEVSFVVDPAGARVYGPGTRSSLYRADMTAVVEQGNGTLVTLDQDGLSTTTLSPSTTLFGSGVTKTDDGHGGLVLADPSGTRIQISATAADVRFTYGPAANVQTMTRPDGSTRRVQEDQSVLERDAAGTVRSLTLADGTRALRASDGTWSATALDGGVHAFAADGTARSVTTAGVVTCFHPDGSREQISTDHTSTFNAAGDEVQVAWSDGRVVSYQAGRVIRTVYADATSQDTIWLFPVDTSLAGYCVVDRSADGSVLDVKDGVGSTVAPEADGRWRIAISDGSTAVLDAHGTLDHIEGADGSQSRQTSADDHLTVDHVAADGAVTETVLSWGGVVLERWSIDAQGTRTLQVRRTTDGTVLYQRLAEGTTQLRAGNGTMLTLRADGTLDAAALGGSPYGAAVEVLTSNGARTVYYADGRAVTTFADGSLDRWSVDRSRMHVSSTGTSWYDAAGRLLTQRDTLLAWAPDGQRATISASSDGYTVTANGQDVVLRLDGSTARYQGTGAGRELTETYTANGVTTRWSRVETALGDITIGLSSDGATTSATSAGVRRDRRADGTVEWTIPNGPSVRIASDESVTAALDGLTLPATVDADGLVHVQEGASISWSLDASAMTVTRSAVSGTSWTLRPDGRYAFAGQTILSDVPSLTTGPDEEGFVTVLGTDLSMTRRLASGWADETRADGTHAFTWPSIGPAGFHLVTEVAADGTIGVTGTAAGNAVATVVDTDGWSVTTSDGITAHLHDDHTMSLEAASGLLMVTLADGGQRCTLPSGATITTFAEGPPRATRPDGSPLAEYNAFQNGEGSLGAIADDGTVTTVLSDLALRIDVGSHRAWPSTSSYPGDGRFMLLYADGRVTASAPDGTLVYTVDGQLVAEGAVVSRTADNSLTVSRSDGSTLTWSVDGAIEKTFLNSLTMLFNPAGGRTLTLPDGISVSISATNAIASVTPQAQAATLDADMTVHLGFESGRGVIVYPNGDIESTLGQLRFVAQADGGVRIDDGPYFHAATSADGSLEATDRFSKTVIGSRTDDASAFVLSDGSTRTYFPDLTVRQTFLNGLTLVSHADGASEAETADGLVMQYASDGTLTSAAANGTSLTIDGSAAVLEDGTSVRIDGATVVTTALDGTSTRALAGGDVQHLDADGDLESTTWAVTAHNVDGTTATRDEGGIALSMTASEGEPPVQQADGTWTRVDAAGAVSTYDAHGSLVQRVLTVPFGGPVETLDGDGRVTLTVGSLTAVRTFDPRTRIEQMSLGSIEADGTVRLVADNGRVDEISRDLHLTQTDPTCASYRLELAPNGAMTAHWPEGSISIRTSDGTVTITTTGTVSQNEDGSWLAILANGSTSTFDVHGLFLGNTGIPGGQEEPAGPSSTQVAFANGVTRTEASDESATWIVPGLGSETYTITVSGDNTRALVATDQDGLALSASWSVPTWWEKAQDMTDLVLGLADGSAILVAPNGLWRHVDGLGAVLEVRRPDGITTVSDGAGGFTSTDVDGNAVTTTVGTDGSFTTSGPWGSLTVYGRDRWTWVAANGLVETVDSQTHRTWSLPEGVSYVQDGGGLSSGTDGWGMDWTDNPRMAALHHWNGQSMERITVKADGTILHAFGSGVRIEKRLDGSRLLSNASVGEFTLTPTEHEGTSTDANGVTRTVYDDGHMTATSPNGSACALAADGTRLYTLPNGMRLQLDANGYPTSVTEADGHDLGPQGWRAAVHQVGGVEVVQVTRWGGQWISVDSNLTVAESDAHGLTRTVTADRTSWTAPGGVSVVSEGDGAVTARDASGALMLAERLEDGRLQVTDARGLVAVLGPDLRVAYSFQGITWTDTAEGADLVEDVTLADGATFHVHNGVSGADAFGRPLGGKVSKAQFDPIGNLVFQVLTGETQVVADLRRDFGRPAVGDDATLLDDGSVARTVTAGVTLVEHLDGEIERRASNGVVELRTTDGLYHYRLPDDSWLHLDAQGWVRTPSYYDRPVDYKSEAFSYSVEADGRFRAIMNEGTVFLLDRATLSVETARPDGTVLVQHADGRGILVGEGELAATQVSRHVNPDGSVAAFDLTTGTLTFESLATGAVATQQPDGSWVAVSSAGVQSTWNAHGILISEKVPGQKETTWSDAGRLSKIAYATGVTVFFNVNGRDRTVQMPDGTLLFLQGADPTRAGAPVSSAIYQDQYALQFAEADGAITVYRPGSARPLWRLEADFGFVRFDAQGKPTQIGHPDGTVEQVEVTPSDNGPWRKVFDDGREEVYSAENILLAKRSPQGDVELFDAAGRRTTLIDAAGVRTTLVSNADGTFTGTGSDGSVSSYDASGRLVAKTAADGTRWAWPGDGVTDFVETFVNGLVMRRALIGQETWTLPDALTVQVNASNVVTVSDASATGTVDSDGTIQITWASGASASLQSDALFSRSDADGNLQFSLDVDGSRTVVANGIQTTTHPDGSEERVDAATQMALSMVAADGTRTLFQADGSSATFSASGTLTTVTTPDGTDATFDAASHRWTAIGYDGSQYHYDAQGKPVSVQRTDGTMTLYHHDGSRTETQTGGGALTYDARGDLIREVTASGDETLYTNWVPTITYHADGSKTVYDANGAALHRDSSTSRDTFRADGSAVRTAAGVVIGVVTPDRTVAARAEDGTWAATDGEGLTWHFDATTALTRLDYPDGSFALYTTDGAVETHSPDGTVRVDRPDGTWTSTAADGTVSVAVADGAVTTTSLDGAFTVTRPDYTVESHALDGLVSIVNPDGSTATVFTDGTRVEEDTDHSVTIRLADGQVYGRDAYGAVTHKAGAEAAAQPCALPLELEVAGAVTLTFDAAGEYHATWLDGRSHESRVGGTIVDVDAAGTVTTAYVSGTRVVQRADGSGTVDQPDGTHLAIAADGTRILTIPDGSTVQQAPGGTPTFTPSEGSTARMQADGTVVVLEGAAVYLYRLDGSTVSFSYGDTTTTGIDGTVVTSSSDGSTTTADADGNTVYAAADGTVTRDLVNGRHEVQSVGGTSTVDMADGSHLTVAAGVSSLLGADGKTWTVSLRDGSSVVRHADGSVSASAQSDMLVQTPAGWKATLSGGATVEWATDGSGDITTMGTDGARTVRHLDGSSFTTYADGTCVLRQADGTRVTTKSDGARTVVHADGSSVALAADGTVVTRDVDGTWTQVRPDGSTLVETADGTLVEKGAPGAGLVRSLQWNNDGTWTRMFSNGATLDGDNAGHLTVHLLDGSRFAVSNSGVVPTLAQHATVVDVGSGWVASFEGGSSINVGNVGAVALTDTDGSVLTFYPDGTIVLTSGDTTISEFSNGSYEKKDDAGTTVWDAGTGDVGWSDPTGSHRWLAEANGNFTRWDGEHWTETLSTGAYIVDGLSPNATSSDDYGHVSSTGVTVWSPPAGNDALDAALAAGDQLYYVTSGRLLTGTHLQFHVGMMSAFHGYTLLDGAPVPDGGAFGLLDKPARPPKIATLVVDVNRDNPDEPEKLEERTIRFSTYVKTTVHNLVEDDIDHVYTFFDAEGKQIGDPIPVDDYTPIRVQTVFAAGHPPPSIAAGETTATLPFELTDIEAPEDPWFDDPLIPTRPLTRVHIRSGNAADGNTVFSKTDGSGQLTSYATNQIVENATEDFEAGTAEGVILNRTSGAITLLPVEGPSFGTYTSQIFDLGRTATFTRASFNAWAPPGGQVSVQIAVSDNPNGPWTFVGPDGTSDSFFTSAGAFTVPVAGRYARYQVLLESDGHSLPVFSQFALDFSGAAPSTTSTYTYAPSGAITSTTTVDAAGKVTRDIRDSASWPVEDRINSLNQLLRRDVIAPDGSVTTWRYTYDGAGNMTSKSDGTNTTTYEWDAGNRLIRATLPDGTTEDFTYNDDGLMLSSKKSTEANAATYVWNGNDLVQETGPDGSVTQYNVVDGLLVSFERGGVTYFVHTSGSNGNIQTVTDVQGRVVFRAGYDEWGRQVDVLDAIPGRMPYGYVGAYGVRWDAELGLYYMRYRFYDPQLQAFVSVDPLSSNQDLYEYANNRPSFYIDPQGTQATQGKYRKLRIKNPSGGWWEMPLQHPLNWTLKPTVYDQRWTTFNGLLKLIKNNPEMILGKGQLVTEPYLRALRWNNGAYYNGRRHYNREVTDMICDGRAFQWVGEVVDSYLKYASPNASVLRADPPGNGWDYFPPTKMNCTGNALLRMIGADRFWAHNEIETIDPEVVAQAYGGGSRVYSVSQLEVGDYVRLNGHNAIVTALKPWIFGKPIAETVILTCTDASTGGTYQGSIDAYARLEGYTFLYGVRKPTRPVQYEIRW